MKLWILSKRKDGDFNYASKRLLEEAAKNDIEITFIAQEDCEILVTSRKEERLFYKGEEADLPDVFWSRKGALTTYFELALLRHMEREQSVFVLNHSEAVEAAKDKLFTFQLLAEKSIPIPKTLLAKFPLDFNVIENQFTYPFVLKKISGTQGKGVFLIKNREQLEEYQELLSGKEQLDNFIIQQYVKTSHGKDIRVFVVGGRAVGAMQRSANKGFKANYSAGGSVQKFALTPELEWLSIEAANTLGLDVAGVDLLFGESGFEICEVNSNPGFHGFEEATEINIPQQIFDFLKLRTK